MFTDVLHYFQRVLLQFWTGPTTAVHRWGADKMSSCSRGPCLLLPVQPALLYRVLPTSSSSSTLLMPNRLPFGPGQVPLFPWPWGGSLSPGRGLWRWLRGMSPQGTSWGVTAASWCWGLQGEPGLGLRQPWWALRWSLLCMGWWVAPNTHTAIPCVAPAGTLLWNRRSALATVGDAESTSLSFISHVPFFIVGLLKNGVLLLFLELRRTPG